MVRRGVRCELERRNIDGETEQGARALHRAKTEITRSSQARIELPLFDSADLDRAGAHRTRRQRRVELA
jgi:hypothetical protein